VAGNPARYFLNCQFLYNTGGHLSRQRTLPVRPLTPMGRTANRAPPCVALCGASPHPYYFLNCQFLYSTGGVISANNGPYSASPHYSAHL